MTSVVSTITNDGKKIILDRTFNAVPTRLSVTKFKVGIGTTDATVADTNLETPVPIAGTEQVDDCDVADWTDGGDCTTSLNSSTYKEGTGSLNVTKDGTGSVNCITYKTTPSLDFTSKELHLWVYIKDAATLAKLDAAGAMAIRFGSDSSNYYYWTKAASFFSTGWNRISGLTSATGTAVGSPVIGACDYTYVEFIATGAAIVWVAGDIAIDDIKLVSSGDFLKLFETGYPVIDYTNFECQIRCRLASSEANGYAIAELGLFNIDSSPLMDSRDTFTAISKGDTDEFIFVAKTIIE